MSGIIGKERHLRYYGQKWVGGAPRVYRMRVVGVAYHNYNMASRTRSEDVDDGRLAHAFV